MDKSKYKKHINVSLQNKKYYDSINPVLLRWADNNENMSEKVSESILMAVRLESSIGINKLMNTFEMIEKTLQIYFPEKNTTYNEAVEKAFAKIVNVNGAMLSDFITNPVQFSEAQLQPSQKQEPVTSSPTTSITEQKPVNNSVIKTEEITKSEEKQEVAKHEKEELVINEDETTQKNAEIPKNVKLEEKQKEDIKVPTPKEDDEFEKENLPEEHKKDENSEQSNPPEEPTEDNQSKVEEVEITEADVSLLFGD
ncbi:hypothetical protein [Bacillus thuringiensis]|uniref:hypothetical protein n=1 Tax=Bacillus thuringiensis TaxID=1428 RepID=UPI0021B4564C|nr:hypothetical protein [Bacillus thuringiensis]